MDLYDEITTTATAGGAHLKGLIIFEAMKVHPLLQRRSSRTVAPRYARKLKNTTTTPLQCNLAMPPPYLPLHLGFLYICKGGLGPTLESVVGPLTK